MPTRKRKKHLVFSIELVVMLDLLIGSTAFGQGKSKTEKPVYLNPNLPVEKRVDDLLERMTLEEKIGQLSQYSGFSEEYKALVREGKVGSFLNVCGAENTNKVQRIALEHSRLGIPLIFGIDVIHGYSTIFPIPLGLASSWDPDIVKKAASIAAMEAAAEGIHWTFAPMVDIARGPRWGRIAEGAGEDPCLGSAMAKAAVEGFQGNNLASPNTLVACPKHYVAYGGAEGGRDYNTVDISERVLREIYLPPFKTAIVNAGARTIMSAFNELNGVPASANRYTLKTILREEWGFDGFVVSDWNAIGELLNHGIARTPAEAAKKAITAGVDMDMQGDVYQKNLARLVEKDEVSEKAINEAVKRILRIKFELGLFEHPYTDPERAPKVIQSKENIQTALEIARRSIVLLKNEEGLLPLEKHIKSVAVIGPLADDHTAPLGPWSCQGNPKDVVSVLDGIKSRVSPKTKVLYAKGCEIEGTQTEGIENAVKIAQECEIAIIVVGESREMSGEAACRAYLDLPGVQEDLVKAIYKTGIPVIEVLMNGRPLSISWSAEHIPAILEAWFPGIQGGNAIADVIFGNYNPGGKLPVTFPRTVGQVPIYYNHKNTGRPPSSDKWTSKYIDVPFTPLFPFGHGLSYTKFEYSNLQITPKRIGPTGKLNVTVDVQNAGNRKGDEVVQLYIRDVVASVTRAVKELKGFKRITLKPGEKKRVEFILTADQLGFYDCDSKKWVVEPGTFEIMIGSSSRDIRLRSNFEVMALSATIVHAQGNGSSANKLADNGWASRAPENSTMWNELTEGERAFLDVVERKAFEFFWNEVDPNTGLISDSLRSSMSSIASVGFGLSAICIADARGWVSDESAYDRVLTTLRSCDPVNPLVEGTHGLFYHFVDASNGKRWGKSEVSTIDSALLMAGVLSAGQHFKGTDIEGLANRIYEAAEWDWFLNPSGAMAGGWSPETELFGEFRGYNEYILLYLLALGSPTHPIPENSWDVWASTYRWVKPYEEIGAFLTPEGTMKPLAYLYQFPACWIDFRGKHDNYADYWQNAVNALKANKRYCIEQGESYGYPEYLWGWTACPGPSGYQGWVAPFNGTISLSAVAASLPFIPDLALPSLLSMYAEYEDKVWGRYGFVSSFNPSVDWYSDGHLGIDQGNMVLMLENFRSGMVWKQFMQIPYVQTGMERAGFLPPSTDLK